MSSANSRKKTTRWDVVAEFLEVYFHSILAWRDVYPETIFEVRRKYGTLVHECTNDQIRDYITRAVGSMNFLVKEKCLKKACLVVTEEGTFGNSVPVEKFVVHIHPDPSAPAWQAMTVAGDDKDPLFAKLEQDFRAALLTVPRLYPGHEHGSHGRPRRKATSGDAAESRSFEIWTVADNQGATRFLSDDVEQQDFPWITVERKFADNDDGELTGSSLIPVRSLDSPVGNIELFVILNR